MHKMIVAIVDHSLLDTICDELKKEKIHFTYWEVKGVGKEVNVSRGAYVRVRIEVMSREEDVERVKGIISGHVPKGVPGAGILVVHDIKEFIDFSPVGEQT
ncbi:MAG: P-II family nitrogen regulator [Acidobacteriota bacterium]